MIYVAYLITEITEEEKCKRFDLTVSMVSTTVEELSKQQDVEIEWSKEGLKNEIESIAELTIE